MRVLVACEYSGRVRDAFRDLWQSIYGTWDANPFVWAVEFRRIKP